MPVNEYRCPLRKGWFGRMKPCAEHKCAWYMGLDGPDPQTGEPTQHYGCAVPWAVTASLQTSKDTRNGLGGLQAAFESLRNHLMRG